MPTRAAAALLDAMPDAMAVLDISGSIVAINRAWREFSVRNGGRAHTTGVGISYLDVCSRALANGCEDAGRVLTGLRNVLAGQTLLSEFDYACPSPDERSWFLLRITPLAGPNPGAVVSHVNITRRRLAEQVDALTGLSNRTHFTSRLATALHPRRGRIGARDVGVLYLDLDSFKPVNDNHGHEAGDQVLALTAARLVALVRTQDTVGRLGGDEFAITVPRVTESALTALAGRIARTCAKPYQINGHDLEVPMSIGTYLAAAGESPSHALRQADHAMFANKRIRTAAKGQLAPRVMR